MNGPQYKTMGKDPIMGQITAPASTGDAAGLLDLIRTAAGISNLEVFTYRLKPAAAIYLGTTATPTWPVGANEDAPEVPAAFSAASVTIRSQGDACLVEFMAVVE
jgi:hypothetical protein